jgi:hypothetical protein
MKTILYGVIAVMLTASSAFAMAKIPQDNSSDPRVKYCLKIVGPIENRVQNDITWEDEGHSDASLKFERFHQCLAKVGL